MDWIFDDGYFVSTSPEHLQIGVIHGYLSRSYWARGITLERVQRSLDHSLCFGMYEGKVQMAFGRVISDYATFGYLSDFFVLETHRGRGLSKRLVACVLQHPDLQDLRRMHLVTRDAHGLYAQFGFKSVERPENHMEITISDAYLRAQAKQVDTA